VGVYMRIQNFYPRQVARKIRRKKFKELNDGEMAAYQFFFLRRRRVRLTSGALNDEMLRDIRKTG
jgi:hypothetical protein